jgi:hypothetical protein
VRVKENSRDCASVMMSIPTIEAHLSAPFHLNAENRQLVHAESKKNRLFSAQLALTL